MSNGSYLVLFDADNIAGYVFDTGRLKEIRGGSYLVRVSTTSGAIAGLAEHDSAAKVIFAGGGAGIVRFSTKAHAEQFIAKLQRRFRQQTVGSTVSAVAVAYEGSFADMVHTGQIALRRYKSSIPQRDRQLVANPYTAICTSCGRRPVQQRYQRRPEPDELLCDTCWSRRTAIDQLRIGAQPLGSRTRSVTVLDLAEAGDELASALLVQSAAWTEAWLPDKLEELGELSRPQRYLGLLHADGNRMGEHLRAFLETGKALDNERQEQRYGDFSRAIASATCEAAVAALVAAFPEPLAGRGRAAQELYTPFDNVLMAGDDLILLVAAHKVLDVAVDFCANFERGIKSKVATLGYTEPITTGVGVVLANASQPILYLQQQAKDLQSQAKKLCAQLRTQGRQESAIDFTVVTTPILRPLPLTRAQEYTLYDNHQTLCLTARPYTKGDLALLLDHIRVLKGLKAGEGAPDELERRSYPRHQLHRLYEAIFQGDLPARLQGTRARLRVNEYQRRMLKAFASEFHALDNFPWVQTEAGAAGQTFDALTPVTDLVELYDFIHDAGHQGQTVANRRAEEVEHG